jgi:hypothetical protein
VKVLRYVVGTIDLGLHFGGKRRNVIVYCWIWTLGSLRQHMFGLCMEEPSLGVVDYSQHCTADSRGRVYGRSRGGKEGLWMRKMLTDMGVAE